MGKTRAREGGWARKPAYNRRLLSHNTRTPDTNRQTQRLNVAHEYHNIIIYKHIHFSLDTHTLSHKHVIERGGREMR